MRGAGHIQQCCWQRCNRESSVKSYWGRSGHSSDTPSHQPWSWLWEASLINHRYSRVAKGFSSGFLKAWVWIPAWLLPGYWISQMLKFSYKMERMGEDNLWGHGAVQWATILQRFSILAWHKKCKLPCYDILIFAAFLLFFNPCRSS